MKRPGEKLIVLLRMQYGQHYAPTVFISAPRFNLSRSKLLFSNKKPLLPFVLHNSMSIGPVRITCVESKIIAETTRTYIIPTHENLSIPSFVSRFPRSKLQQKSLAKPA